MVVSACVGVLVIVSGTLFQRPVLSVSRGPLLESASSSLPNLLGPSLLSQFVLDFEKSADKHCAILVFQVYGGCESKPRVIPVLFTWICVSNDFDLMKYARGVQLSSRFLSEIRLRAFFREFLLSKAPPHEGVIRGISQDHFGRQAICFTRSFIDTST